MPTFLVGPDLLGRRVESVAFSRSHRRTRGEDTPRSRNSPQGVLAAILELESGARDEILDVCETSTSEA